MKKKLKILLLIVIACPFIIWASAITKCEVLSFQYGKEFEGLEESSTNMISKSETVKVLEYNKMSARIYYKNRYYGNIFRFIKQDGKWVLDGWETVWSRAGSADGFMWPYIR
ncbi:MAG: hypothetical protein Q8882_07385 [Bacillota bacterium]|nr:hypothetical protein [Bacillota bacterium]